MLPVVRRGLAVASFAILVSFPASGAPAGSVLGKKEDPIGALIQQALALEKEAEEIVLSGDPFLPLDIEGKGVVTTRLTDSIAVLQQAIAALDSGGPYQDSTEVDLVRTSLNNAIAGDQSVLADVAKNALAIRFSGELSDTIQDKIGAFCILGGVRVSKKDKAAIDANGGDPASIPHDAEISGTRGDVSVKKGDIADGTGDVVDAGAKAKKVPALKPYKELVLAGGAPKPVKNYYYAFEGKKATPGYIFKSFGRQLFGPFETRFQVGAFDPNRYEDTGSACIEFDLEGSNPLQFVAVCGRRITGGVQVFVQSNAGSGGSLFLPGARIAQVLVNYDGTTFTVKAGIQGTPDFALSSVGNATMAQGETAIIAGLGASGLTKGAEIGLDEIFFTAK